MICQDKRAADYHAAEETKQYIKKFCPAFATRCKGAKCQAFRPAEISRDGQYWVLQSPGCKSPLVMGEV